MEVDATSKEDLGAGETGDGPSGSSGKNDVQGKCKVCSGPATKSCSACQLVKYCSGDHQKEDWPTHKEVCSATMLKADATFGRYLIAARKLKAGTLILEEEPALNAPRGLVDDFATPICLSCCVLMTYESADYRCSKCNWPTCCWTCEQHKIHSQNECPIFVEKKIPYPPPGDYPVHVAYKVIEILRGVLLKEKNPELWKKLQGLQHVTDLGTMTELFKDLPKLRTAFGVENIGTEEDWARVLGILNVNNFSMEGQRGGDGPSFSGYVFLQASMLTHSCAPNCWWGVSVFPSQKIQVRTTVDVQKGEMLTIPYSYVYNAFGTHKRQELIQSDGEFICKCRRCVDPTELGSYASALVCGKCQSGRILPIDPVLSQSTWKCDNCSNTFPWDSVNTTIEGLMTALESCQSLSEMEAFVSRNQGKTVHSNHWLITEAEEVICQQRTKSLYERDDISLGERDKHITICEHLLRVKNIIAPGFSLERGRLINYLARARFEKLELIVKDGILSDREEISAEAEFIYLLYDEALSFYKNDVTEVQNHEKLGFKCRMIMSDMKYVKERFINNSESSMQIP